MDKKEIIRFYELNKIEIKNRLLDFKKLEDKNHYYELLFCLLTPQSNAKKCWEAVIEIKKLKIFQEEKIRAILKSKTRFHNNKTRYILESRKTWENIKEKIYQKEIDSLELRNYLEENVTGYGLKEAGHFLRNIGKSDNKIAILDRHILRNLKELGVIDDDKIKNKKHYLEIEKRFIEFSNKINIPIDELDLLFWSKENGEIFK